MRTAARYSAAAALLGAGWFVVLLVPPWTRAWLVSDRRMIAWNAVLLATTSVIVAWAFRGTIGRATEPRQHWVRAALLPYAGCVVYLTLWNVVNAVIDVARGGSVNIHDSLVLYPWGLGYSMAACFVVVPYGLLCQYVMKKALEGRPDPGVARHAA